MSRLFHFVLFCFLAIPATPGSGQPFTFGDIAFLAQQSGGAASVVTNPSPYLLDLNADLGVFSDSGITPATNNGSLIGQWNDQSGNGYNFTQAVRPALETNILNGHSIVRYASSPYGGGLSGGTGDSLVNTNLVHSCPLVVYMVVAVASGDWSLGQIFYYSPNSTSAPGLFGEHNPANLFTGATGDYNITTALFPTNRFNLITVSWFSASNNIRLNGADIGSSANGTDVGFNGLGIEPSFLSYCDIARFIISTNASLLSVINTEHMLSTNYNITL